MYILNDWYCCACVLVEGDNFRYTAVCKPHTYSFRERSQQSSRSFRLTQFLLLVIGLSVAINIPRFS